MAHPPVESEKPLVVETFERKDHDEAPLSDPARDRLFAHGLHEDTIFNERLNFFLVFESVLLGIVATIYGGDPQDLPRTILALLAALGGAITVLWLYIQRYQNALRKVLVERAERHVPEFARTRAIARQRRGRGPTASFLLTYAIPILVLFVWVAVFILIVMSHPKPPSP